MISVWSRIPQIVCVFVYNAHVVANTVTVDVFHTTSGYSLCWFTTGNVRHTGLLMPFNDLCLSLQAVNLSYELSHCLSLSCYSLSLITLPFSPLSPPNAAISPRGERTTPLLPPFFMADNVPINYFR